MALSEQQIRPAKLMEGKSSCIEHDRQYLLDRRDQWVMVDCPGCGHGGSALFGEKHGFAYRQCSACLTVYTSPRPSREVLEAFYLNSENYAYWNEHIFPATEDARRLNIFRPRAERLSKYIAECGAEGGTLFEVGSAFGTFLSEAAATGLFDRVVGVEPTPGLAQQRSS